MLAFFKAFFPAHVVGPQDSFETLGGESLSYIRFSMGFEKTYGALPRGWEKLTIAQLHDSLEASPQTGMHKVASRLKSPTLTRAFFMICIVVLHLDVFSYSSNWGAAYFLFMRCGYSIMRFQWP
nr:hypothetical protein [uncultured Devosia sp.]